MHLRSCGRQGRAGVSMLHRSSCAAQRMHAGRQLMVSWDAFFCVSQPLPQESQSDAQEGRLDVELAFTLACIAAAIGASVDRPRSSGREGRPAEFLCQPAVAGDGSSNVRRPANGVDGLVNACSGRLLWKTRPPPERRRKLRFPRTGSDWVWILSWAGRGLARWGAEACFFFLL